LHKAKLHFAFLREKQSLREVKLRFTLLKEKFAQSQTSVREAKSNFASLSKVELRFASLHFTRGALKGSVRRSERFVKDFENHLASASNFGKSFAS
jgi:hypothetical protein